MYLSILTRSSGFASTYKLTKNIESSEEITRKLHLQQYRERHDIVVCTSCNTFAFRRNFIFVHLSTAIVDPQSDADQ